MGGERTTHVILGDGVAGMSAAEAIRARSPDDRIVVVSDDPQPYYYRASLTNYLMGELSDAELWGLPPDGWEALRIERVADRAVGLDAAARTVRLERTGALAYDRLLVATGARARRLEGVPGAELAGVGVLRTLRDTRRLLEAAARAKRAVVLGGGILGIEIAQGLRARNVAVTLVHRGGWLLDRVVDRRAGELIRRRMERDGVEVRTGAGIAAIEGGAKGVRRAVLDDGSSVDAQLVAVAIGNAPNTEFLAGSALRLDGGLVPVDRRMRAAGDGVEDVHAAGDVARFVDPDLPFGNPSGLWQPARRQGHVAGLAMSGSPRAKYRPGAVYNATRAWDLDLGSLGDPVHASPSGGGRDVVFEARRDGKPVYKRAVLRDGRVVAALLLGDRREGRALHRLMNLRGDAADASTIADRLFDPSFDLAAWVAAQERQPGVLRFHETVLLPRGALPPSVAASTPAVTQRAIALRPTAAPPSADGPSHPLVLVAGPREASFPGPRVRIGGGTGCDVAVFGVGSDEIALAREGALWIASTPPERGARARRNGLPLSQPAVLADRDVLELGTWRGLVRLAGLPTAGSASAARTGGWLVGVRRHALDRPVVSIGSSADNDVVLAGPGVSPFHAQVHRTGGEHYVVDAGSEGGTFVGDEPVTVPRRLRADDVVRLGDVRLVFRPVVEAAPAEAEGGRVPAPGPRVFLVGLEGPLARRALAVPLGGTVGRGRAADVRVADPLLSRVHARFAGRLGEATITDLGSGNGVAVEGERLRPDAATALRTGARVRLGRNVFRFQEHEPTERALSAEETGDPRTGETGTVLLRGDGARLEVAGPEPAVHPLAGDDVRIGRAAWNDVVVGRADVSKEHARLVRRGDGWSLVDLGSTYGTRVNHAPVPPGEERALSDGDVLEIASASATFRAGVPAAHAAGGARATLTLLDAPPGAPVDPIALSGAGPFLVGRRRDECDAVVPLQRVSRRHAQIRRDGAGFRIRNLSDHGTEVNGAPVTAEEGVPLASGDVVALQDVRLRFEVLAEAPRATVAHGAGPDLLAAVASPLDGDLRTSVEQELDACIGCHDCLRACPLPDAASVTIGALNAYALGVGEPTDRVRRFVADCTQCHACVPVCPADLRRSRMVLWNKLKHVPDPDRRVSLQVGSSRREAPWTLAELARRLADHALLRPLSEADRLSLLARARVRRLATGEAVVSEAVYPDAAWLLLDGRLDVGMATARGFQSMVVLSPGQTVGEVAVLSDQPSEVTARALEPATVVGFPKYVLLEQAQRSAGFEAVLRGLYASASVQGTLARLPGLRDADDAARAALAEAFRVERHEAGAVVATAGPAGAVFRVIRRGFVREIREDGGREIVGNYLKAGESFGGPGSGRRGRLVRHEASTTAETLALGVEELRALERLHPGLRERLCPTSPSGGLRPAAGETALFAAAERGGLLQARGLLVIDTRLCVDCDNCVAACERRHGAPRLDRLGASKQVGPFQVPASCYHCEDPVCLFCSVDGIVREPSGEIRVVEDRCIGCGACAERCPYDNIVMRPRDTDQPLWKRVVPDPLLRLLGLLGEATSDADRVAVKCDLCAGYESGPACVRSCPTGAAFRGDPAAVFARASAAP